MQTPAANPTYSPEMSIKHDPFIQELLKRIPGEQSLSFTNEQLLSLKVALSGRKWGKHTLDVRGTFGFWTWRYYYVLVGGRERRILSAREEQIHRVTNACVLFSFLTFSVLLGLLFLYLIKSAAGIDFFPDSHLEIIPGYDGSTWEWFQEKIF